MTPAPKSITWIPVPDQGHFNGIHPVGNGAYYDEVRSILSTGAFNSSGQLNGENCTKINYRASDNVSIRIGTFINGLEDGTIVEYVFPKSDWNTFAQTQSGLSSTKYTHIFSNGAWQSTSSTQPNLLLDSVVQKNPESPYNFTSFVMYETDV